jgi:hypothetical protein
MNSPRIALSALVVALLAPASFGDEGMWTFHNPPVAQLRQQYGFELTEAWLEHVRLSSVRLNSGGSGSFVSPRGLVLTNHHVASDAIHKLSTEGRDLIRDGYHATSEAEELRCQDLELNVLVAMSDVTAQVKAAGEGKSPDEAALARRAEIGRLEKEAREATNLRSDVVTLYRGGEYWLYQFKQYTDVRLVFAPEVAIGFFGGDPDNFTYPRFNLDFAFFRVYEDGKPAATPHHLKWSVEGLAEGDLVFTSGHPGSTQRLLTQAQIDYLREVSKPRVLDLLGRMSAALNRYGALGEEERRQAADDLFGIENSRKANTGQLEGLRDPALTERKAREEKALREAIAADPALQATVGDAFDVIEKTQREIAALDAERVYRRLRGKLAGHASSIVQLVAEVEKPNGERLPAYRDSSLDSTKLSLFSTAPVYSGLEEVLLRTGLELAAENLGADDAFVQAALGGESPAAAAKRMIGGTKLGDPAFRQQLVAGGKDAVASSEDPLIRVAIALDPMWRDAQRRGEALGTVIADAAGRISQARFQLYGTSVYPDATFTLRLAYGTAKGYSEDTTLVPWKTTFYGLFERNAAFDGKQPFALPKRYLERISKIELATPLNFVHTCDITGGNSGSPTLNRNGEIVGLVFDGNIQSLPNDLIYGNSADRAVSVHCAGILEALASIYDADALVAELRGAD